MKETNCSAMSIELGDSLLGELNDLKLERNSMKTDLLVYYILKKSHKS